MYLGAAPGYVLPREPSSALSTKTSTDMTPDLVHGPVAVCRIPLPPHLSCGNPAASSDLDIRYCRRIKIMAIAQRIAATAMFASVAVAAASPVWADPADQMSGTYTVQSPNDPQLSTWTITPCGSACVNITSDRIRGTRQARLANLEWIFSINQVVCPDGSSVAGRTTYSWNPYTLTGTRRRSSNEAPACGVAPIDDAMVLSLTRVS